jgi:hypothetical protein
VAKSAGELGTVSTKHSEGTLTRTPKRASRHWISKATNRPVRSDMINDAWSMQMLTVSRYEYASVQAPARVVTMEEMIKSKSGH